MLPTKITLKVRLILIYENQILLLKQTKTKGGNYTLVGGSIEDGEFARQTLIRESYEEAGVILREGDLELVHVLHKKKPKEHRMTLYFKAICWEGKLKSKEPHKFKKVEWYDLNELPENLTETVAYVLGAFQNGYTYSEMKKG